MKKLILMVIAVAVFCWSIPKPMESVENYNVMLLHGAYGSDQGFLGITDTNKTAEAYNAKAYLDNGAALGRYHENRGDKQRLLHWLTTKILEEPEMDADDVHPKHSYVYHWRSFSNPANSSVNNAVELGKRSWHMAGFEHRRAMMEEAQEVKASFYDITKDDSLHGQKALDSIRKNSDLYRQLASRYILIGHSMGGVVSREYVQGDCYNGDVDKVITLDSPHEGTGALNMQLRMADGYETYGKTVTQVMFTAGIGGITLALLGGSEFAVKALFLTTASLTPINFLLDLPVLRGLEEYHESDPLVCYVDPHGKEKDACKDSVNIKDLEVRSFIADSMPMFRLLAGQHSMTFTDPKLSWRNAVSWLVPEALTSAVVNVGAQAVGGGSGQVNNTNSITGLVLGLIGGVNLQDHGSSLVKTSNGLGLNTSMLIDPNVDVKRSTFNAAKYASEAGLSAFNYTLSAFEVAFVGMSFIPNEAIKKAARASLVSVTAFSIGEMFLAAIALGAQDLSESHMMPLYKKNLEDWYGERNFFSPIGSGESSHTPYLMEDFLYERPFVNLALNDSRTMGLLAQDSSLNPNCYFESDSLNKEPFCEVGLYGSRDSVVIDPVTMKETPVYNAAVVKTDSAGNVVLDSLGKVVYDSVYYGSFEQRNYSDFRNSPLRFKSESDWSKMGVKVDRWERVDGLKPNGDLAPKGVPIRHVERYNVPDIVVDGFIEMYSFVVDDLMPHRMRQIKMMFNSKEEVAWECDVKASVDDPHACAVYKRHVGDSWGSPDTTIGDNGYVPHPIKKNGRFDFNARDYFGNLADIQKDNQNTVMISMVNKIGLSNTQRFYYLFKATENMLKPAWPQHDVVLNAVDGFGVYVSALDYQGFRVRSAKDGIFSDPLGTPKQVGDTQSMDMTVGTDGSSAVFASNQKIQEPVEGDYRWVVDAVVNNDSLDSSKTDSYEVHFKVDRTAPAFTLTSDVMMNPDSSMFVTRFKWVGADSADRANGSDIRVMRWTLEKAVSSSSSGSQTTFAKFAELPALYDVASNEFAIAWDKVPQDKCNAMGDGLYRIAAYAVDYAVPNEGAYNVVNGLVDKIFSNPSGVSEDDWLELRSLNLNDTTVYAEFRVDRTAPVFMYRGTGTVPLSQDELAGVAVDLSGKYDVLRANRPAREQDLTYVSADSLLNILYTVQEGTSGRDSAAVTVGWNFVHYPDTNVVDHAGDSVWVFDSLGGRTSGSWTEMAGLRLADGDYDVRAVLRDEAKNVHQDIVLKRVRVDRTAPQIVGLTSDHLVYTDILGDFSATLVVSEKADIGVNRTGMHCSYRVLGGADSLWHVIRKGDDELLSSDTVKFSIEKSTVDTARGLRYLEAACIDAAGNVSVRTDLFHVGARFPQITYPQADSIQSDLQYIPIVGIAPKTSSKDSLSSVYRLRYRVGDDTTWRADKVKVVAANRSESADNVSRISQGTEGVLGYLENDGFGDEALVYVELAVASCDSCDDWSAVTSNIVLIPPKANSDKPAVEFSVTRDGRNIETFNVGDGPVDISVRLKNRFNGNYMLRVYAEDSKHRGVFDASREKVFYNPYYGMPTATSDSGIWFYELEGKYYLKWKNLERVNLKVGYNSAKFGESCKGPDRSLDMGCSTEYAPLNIGSMIDAAKAYLADYPEWMPPAYTDSVMTIAIASGEIVLEAEDAFRVYVERKDAQDTSALNVPVYFGESSESGFYWNAGVDTTVSPLMTGWTVNPEAYGLNFRWDGISTSGAYPSGDLTLYAEVTENILDNPYVTVVEKILHVEQKNAELVVSKSLPDYMALKVADSDDAAYMRDSMKVYFGLKNADAHVEISIVNADTVVATILDKTLKAHTGDSAYSVTWDGKNRFGDVQSEGVYYVRFEVYSDSTRVTELQSEIVPFKVKLRNGMTDETPDDPKDPNKSGFYVAEAKKVANDIYRYEPYADYLVVANMDGWYLPDSLRNRTYNVTGTVEGSQKILGFRPERFSLGIKRHRDTLEMYVVSKLYNETVRLDNCVGGCDFKHESETSYTLDYTIFTDEKRNFTINYDLGYPSKGFDKPSESYMDVVACTNKTWQRLIDARNKNGIITEAFFDTLKRECEWSLDKLLGAGEEHFFLPDPGRCVEPKLDVLKNWPDSLFKMAAVKCNRPKTASKNEWLENPDRMQYVDSCLAEFLCPNIIFEEKTLLSDDENVGCVVDTTENGYIRKVCDKSDSRYDPNLRLFDVVFTPAENKRFFSDWAFVNSYHKEEYYWTRVHFSMTLSIPESYWNAPFGMDNLVNRTILFDHANSTIYSGGSDDGYWNAVKGNGRNDRPVNSDAGNYFDGNVWTFDQRYGLLTPLEVQRLDFYPASEFPAGSNVFLFDDESERYMYSSRYELKFYGHDSSTHHFEAKVVGNLANPSSVAECETDATKFVEPFNVENPCQVSLTSASNGSVRTPVFTHGNVHFFVGMNRLWSEGDKKNGTTLAYPADPNSWRISAIASCSSEKTYESFKSMAEGDESAACYKYYGAASRVHYYFGDYDDNAWKTYFITDDESHYFRNKVNSPASYFGPDYIDSLLIARRLSVDGNDFLISLKPDSLNFERFGAADSVRFKIPLDSLAKMREGYAGAGIDIDRINIDLSALDRSATYDSAAMSLYVNAERWADTVVYRRSNDTTKTVLERPGDTISVRDVYTFRVDPDANGCGKALYCVDTLHPQSGLVLNPWIKDPVVASATVRQVDFTEHPVLGISDTRDLDDRRIVFKDTVVPRPPELVEVRGKLTPGQVYALSFLNNSKYYTISDTLTVKPDCARYPDGSCHLVWFDVNRLQGRTQFLLTWGGADGNPTNAMHFNMYIGSAVEPDKNGVVKSMYGELTVTFPEGSLDRADDFTVRTVNVQEDYGFGVFKNMALTGPVMEVLPSMTFKDTNNLPRIQMKISRQEMENMNVTPQTLRLYKVDFDRQEFVPLENVLYGYLHEDGSAVMSTNGRDALRCDGRNDSDTRCSNKNSFAWEYVLISAETRTFSVFVAMDSLAASMPRVGLDVLPVVAKYPEREVRVYGVEDFSLYVDDDSLWNDEGDLTPVAPLSFSQDMNGIVRVTLPDRLGEIDTNYVFAFANVDGEDRFAPAVVKVLTVPATFACHVPSDSLWMGTDNGFLAYGAGCNHPGYGMLSLYKDNSLVAEIRGEIPDTIRYDGKKLVGGSVVGRLSDGRYETRYVGFSDLGGDLQLVGPAVRTDSARPVIDAFEVLSGEDALDRVFTVRANVNDAESGIARVVVSSKLGNATRAPLVLVPDSLGDVNGVIRLSRSELSKCSGCRLSLEMRAEDYGHNYAEKYYESEEMYPYPSQLALWFPSREGTGDFAREYIGTGHDLDLRSVTSPWLGDAGIYFSKMDDRAVGVGRVGLGTSSSYSFETRLKVGHAGGDDWRRVLGFKGIGGLEMELFVNGRKLQLREGTHAWETPDHVLPVEKEWSHVVVTVDSSEVNFYVNGEIVKSAVVEPLERELDGVFSAGGYAGNSFIGNMADVRMYKRALSGGEVFALSLPVSDDKGTAPEIIEIVTVPMLTVDVGDGFEPEFSCAVAGNRYFESGRDGAKLTMNARIEKAGTYKVMMYVRSALLKSASVAVSPSAGMRYNGAVTLSPVWRTESVSGISMNLSAGMHEIALEAPEGLQVAGFALVTTNVDASSIAWNAGLENPDRKVKTFVRYEGFDDKKILQPRVRLKNISGSQIDGYSVRYYFRGEESSLAKVYAYYPHDTAGLTLHSESARTGFAEWKFEDGVIPPYGMVFNGDGPHFGLHYEDWTPWTPYDDPSFVEDAAYDFVEDDGIIVLDTDKRLIGGACVEMEDSVSAEVKARVYATETRNDNQASEIQLKVENVGNVTLKNYDVRYYFFLEGGLAPQLESYVLPDGVSATLENIGEGRWLLSLRGSKPLVSGGAWKDNAQIVLHCENWNDVWNASDDPGRVGLGRDMVEAVGVNVFDSLGNRIYGNEPDWPEVAHIVMPDSSEVPDYGLEQNDDRIPIHRTEDGLVVEIPLYTNISLSLVNAVGVPIRSIYSGILAPGEQFIAVDWGGVDLNRTYLLLRVNGTIKSTKLLSLL